MRILLTADWHLRSSRPRCRLDTDWMETQMKALEQIGSLADKHKVDAIVVVGDVFDTAAADVTFSLITAVQSWAGQLRQPLYLIAGNHDLQYHDIANLKKSGVGILLNSFNIFPAIALRDGLNEDINAYDFGEEKRTDEFTDNDYPPDAEIVFIHRLVFPDQKSLPPNVNANTASDILKEFPEAKYIFTGDYHKSFVVEKKGRYVINPGCILRQDADEKDYNCSVFIIDTEKEKPVRVTCAIEDDMDLVTDEYLRDAEERENRIDAFVELLKSKGAMTLDFIKNVEARLRENKDIYDDDDNKVLTDETVKAIRELIYEE